MKILKYCLILFNFFLTSILADAQAFKDPDEFLIPGGMDNLPKVFLVGTFHFDYPNLDAYKIDKSKQIDILSEQKQKELEELLAYISIFKPTKICVEAPEEWNTINKYRLYKSGKNRLGRDEKEQIAFRLMDRFKLDTLYSVDATSVSENLEQDSIIAKRYIEEIFKDYSFKTNENYQKWFEYNTQQNTKVSLLEYFKYLNSPKRLLRDYGGYLLGDFKNGAYNGADALSIYWYNRNLRIFRNIQRITTSPEDRVLVLFGASHVAILDQLFKCSTEFNYIKFNDLK